MLEINRETGLNPVSFKHDHEICDGANIARRKREASRYQVMVSEQHTVQKHLSLYSFCPAQEN